MKERYSYRTETFNYFPFSKNHKKDINNRISDSDLQFKEVSPEHVQRMKELHRTMDEFGVKDPLKKASYINFKIEMMGNKVNEQAGDRIEEKAKEKLMFSKQNVVDQKQQQLEEIKKLHSKLFSQHIANKATIDFWDQQV